VISHPQKQTEPSSTESGGGPQKKARAVTERLGLISVIESAETEEARAREEIGEGIGITMCRPASGFTTRHGESVSWERKKLESGR